MEAILKKIKRVRNQKRLTQKEIAEVLCVSQSSYAKIESGNVALTVDYLLKIAQILNVPVTWFLKDENAKYESKRESVSSQNFRKIFSGQSEFPSSGENKINFFYSIVESLLFDREIQVSDNYLQTIPYEDLNERLLDSLEAGITAETYSDLNGIEAPSVSREVIFEEMIEDMTIY